MTNLNDEQRAALAAFSGWATERRTLKATFEQQMAALRAEREAAFYAGHDLRGLAVVSRCVSLGVPKARLAKAYGTTDKRTIYDLIERYGHAAADPETLEVIEAEAQTATGSYNLTPDLVLSVHNWHSEVTPGVVLNFNDVQLKQTGRVAGHLTDELLPLNHELVNNTALGRAVREEIAG